MDDIIGIIMIANTIPAVNMSRPNGVFAKKGREPKASYNGFSIKSRTPKPKHE